MQDQTILIEQHPGYRVITLHRPQRLNAFSEPMHQELRHAIDEAEGDAGCRALLLTGYGRAFCAGQDLNERLAKDGKTMVLGSALDTYYNPLIRKLRALPFPIVAAVNGIAAGAGANVALACDIVLAARSASFAQAFFSWSWGGEFQPRCAKEQAFFPYFLVRIHAHVHAILANEIFMPQRRESYSALLCKLCRIDKPALKVLPIPVAQFMRVRLAFALRKLGRFNPNEA